MSTQKLKKGFTLIELMVVIVIIGILAAIAIPKLFGMTAKAKAQEVGPAAGTWVKLHQAYYMEKGKNGTFGQIGYIPPGTYTKAGNSGADNDDAKGKGVSTYFTYTEGGATLKAGDWQGKNDIGALGNGCEKDKWLGLLSFTGKTDGDMPIVTDVEDDKCKALTPNFKDLGTTN